MNLTGALYFTDAVTYTVTAENGSTQNYAVTATSMSGAKQITSFVFLLTNNPIEVNVVATIDEENKTISEIAYEVGFNDSSWFSRAFKDEFGLYQLILINS